MTKNSHSLSPTRGSVRGVAHTLPERTSDQPDEAVRKVMYQSVVVIVVVTLVVVTLGVVMVYSATTPSGIHFSRLGGGSAFTTANKQLLYTVAGIVLAGVVAHIRFPFFRAFSYAIFGAGLILQSLVVPFGIEIGGNRNWIAIGPIVLQPSEFLKLATIVWLAAVLARVDSENATFKEYAIPAGVGVILGLGDIMLGKDMGTAMMYVLICLGMFWVAGIPARYFLWVGGVGIAVMAGLVAISPSRLARVTSYARNIFTLPDKINPTQSDFALWAFGSGGLSGTGLGTGVEKWPGNLAEAQTDFIFAVIGEELGFFGCIVVVVLFAVLGISLMMMSRHHPSRFACYVCVGVALWICGQGLANMLVVTGVFPVFGVPLPFLSQGGSSMVACLMAVGLALSCALTMPGVRESFRVRANLISHARALLRKD